MQSRNKPIKKESSQNLENIVCGRNSVRELLRAHRSIDKIFAQKIENDGSLNEILTLAFDLKIPVTFVEKQKLDSLCGGSYHQGIVAFIPEREYSTVDEILNEAKEKNEDPFIIVCDGIEDPHNLGAIIRTCECCGVHGVIIPKRNSVSLTSVVSKASAGALEHVKVARVTNLARILDELKEQNIWAYAVDMDGTSFYTTSLKGPAVFVLGSEGFGISRLLKEKCDFVVSIPLYGKVNSLNVSNAAAVILCEAARQRHLN